MTDLALAVKELEDSATKTEQILATLSALPVVTQEDADWAGQRLHDVKAHWKRLEEQRTAVTKPLNEGLRNINTMFRRVQEPLVQAESVLKSKLAAFARGQEERRVEAMLAASTGDVEALAQTAPVPALAGISTREAWGFTVTNPDTVPREFCSPDPAKLRAYLKPANTPFRDIPGVRVFREDVVTVRVSER